jgi:hypothetical protein
MAKTYSPYILGFDNLTTTMWGTTIESIFYFAVFALDLLWELVIFAGKHTDYGIDDELSTLTACSMKYGPSWHFWLYFSFLVPLLVCLIFSVVFMINTWVYWDNSSKQFSSDYCWFLVIFIVCYVPFAVFMYVYLSGKALDQPKTNYQVFLATRIWSATYNIFVGLVMFLDWLGCCKSKGNVQENGGNIAIV